MLLAEGMLAVGIMGVGTIVRVCLKVFLILGILGMVGNKGFGTEGLGTMGVGMVLVCLLNCSE